MPLDKMLLIVKPSDNSTLVNRFREIRNYLNYHGCEFDIAFTEYSKHAWKLANENADKYGTIVSVGGDGTLNEVVNGVMFSKNPRVSIGVLPLGSGNDYLRNFGIMNHMQALEMLLPGEIQNVDVGCAEFCDDITGESHARYYCNLASVGLGAKVARNADKYFKRFGGTLGYLLSFLLTVVEEQPFEMKIKADSLTTHGRRFWEVQANIGVYVAGGMKATPHSNMYDGLLGTLVVHQMKKVELLKTFPKIYTGKHLSHPKVDHFNAGRVEITAHNLEVNLDGELAGKTPVVLSVLPKSLSLRIKEFETRH